MNRNNLIRDQLAVAHLRTALEDAPTTAIQRQRVSSCFTHIESRLLILATGEAEHDGAMGEANPA